MSNTVETMASEGLSESSSLGKGRIPSAESLRRRIFRIRKIMAKAQKLCEQLPALEAKLAIVSDPAFASRRELAEREKVSGKADKAMALLASLPPDLRAQILASLQ